MFRKGQAGLDFLMTYGWALVIIVLVIGVLFALGIFNVGSFAGNRVAGFTTMGVAAYNFVGSTGALTVRFVNRAGTQVNVTGIACAFETAATAADCTNPSAFTLSSGAASSDIPITTTKVGTYKANDYYSVRLDINYTDVKTGFNYTDSGTLSGKAA